MLIYFLFALAAAFHFSALGFAVRMAWGRPRGTPWVLLAATLLLMMSVRIYGLLTTGSDPVLVVPPDRMRLVLAANSALVSALFLVSLVLIRRVVLARDTSDQALRQSEKYLRLGLQLGNTGTWDYDIINNKVTWSEVIYTLHGLKPGEFGGRVEDFAPLIHPDDRQRVTDAVRRAVDQRASYHAEYRALRPDGKLQWISTTGEVLYDVSGKPYRMLGAASDITQRKQAENALLESEERWKLALSAARDGIWDWNIATGELYWSPRCKEMLGFSDEGLPIRNAQDIQSIMHPEDLAHGWENAQKHLRRETPVYQDEFRARHRDGSYRWIYSRGQATFDASGNPVRMTGSNTDATERKRLEEERESLLSREHTARVEAERASKAKDEFIAVLSHELRTPLTPVLLTVSLLEAHPKLPDDLRSDVATIRRNVELESRLISDLLDLTRISRGKLQLDREQVDVHLLLRSAVAICQREDSVRLDLDLAAERHFVFGDATRLQQVFWNLINNAQKFTPPDGLISIRTSDAENDCIRVEVRDTGAGIDPAILPRLFNAFEQGEVRATRQFAGLGLGLAISKRLVDVHGGTISAQSQGKGTGATFIVELPTVAAPLDAPAKPGPTPQRSPTRPLTILLVEDHEATARVMAKLLKNMGHEVKTVFSLASAIAAASTSQYDLLLSDIGLPDGSGLDLMRQLRQQYAGKAVALTGYGMEEDIRNSRDAGFTAHVTKPVDVDRLRETIDQFAGGDGES